MKRFQFLERDNCGVGVIANKYGIAEHDILIKGISALIKLSHRGAIQSDGRTGDGCGLLVQIPDEYFRALFADEGEFKLCNTYAVGNIFFSFEQISIAEQKQVILDECSKLGLRDVFFRRVPMNVEVLGRIAKNSLPHVEQLFINAAADCLEQDFELKLFALRKNIEYHLNEIEDFFICSLSNHTIVYKALCLPHILKEFYLDLANPLFKTSICIFHQRFSTNTQPSWKLAQPFRYLAHNGEINTVSANRLWAKARGLSLLPTPVLANVEKLNNMVSESGSDSFSLDNMFEMLLASGADFKQALRALIPPYWHNNYKLSEDVQKWYETVAIGLEPWDGPAGIVCSNGRQVMCCLDRNGLRPLRYSITQDGTVIVASEAGIVDYETEDFVVKSRLGAGEMILIDTHTKTVSFDDEIYSHFDLSHLHNNHYLVPQLTDNLLRDTCLQLKHNLTIYKKLFLVTDEEIESVIKVSAFSGAEPTMSMGDDTAIAILAHNIRPITDYFRQSFAQVTNPAIDSIREKYVMSLDTYIGVKSNLIESNDMYGYKLESPILTDALFDLIFNEDVTWKKVIQLDLAFDEKLVSLEGAIRNLCLEAEHAIFDGVTIIVISDMVISENALTIPAAMVVGAIHNHLIMRQIRFKVDLIVATATARDPHHFCVLLGFGANAIYPYLSYRLIEDLHMRQVIKALELATLINNYTSAIDKGILKIMSKMGIATLASYRGSQLFEALGVDDDVVKLCFTAAITRIKGARFSNIQNDMTKIRTLAFNNNQAISMGGNLKYTYFGEYHAFNPDVVAKLQYAVRSGQLEDYYVYADEVNQRQPLCLRDLLHIKLSLKKDANKHYARVDSVEDLYRRFDSAAMSIGALGAEAHEALAIAMNSIGGRSNSGEGGEDPLRFGTIRNSKIKQIASGRFGVTPHYLMSAEVIQIKIAQGAKPGEGGQLPGEKVSAEIATLRHATPGVTLISPPPHHDVYSIEDLAQLIFDLKQLNPGARISVKLVSEPGIGVIACGVAKANADLVTISGYDGGTGAAPITSVKNAGSPWELGIAETHAALVQNNLRHKIRLQVDGGLKTGLDVVKAAILGAESFGFGTAPMVALGCKYLRICHLNNCATGIATQNEKLRKEHFKGLPEMVINYFKGVADEVQQLLLELGVSQLVDLIGRTDLLEQISSEDINIDLSQMLAMSATKSNYPLYYSEANVGNDKGVLNQRIFADCMEAVSSFTGVTKNYTIYNTDRSVGATLAGEIVKTYGAKGLDDPIVLYFEGIAGQSFGVWATRGMELYLYGEANDYVAKGLAGGKIVIKHSNSNISGAVTLMGNTCLYGATSGYLYANGGAGDRFAARNSGVVAIIEGLASNGCEYMTGGVVIVLGSIDQNFGAGMTGGVCYIWDAIEQVNKNLNYDFVEAVYLNDIGETYHEHFNYINSFVQNHYQETRSAKAARFLADFESNMRNLIMVKPKGLNYKNLLNYLIK